jgi:hypothetical protein
MYFGHLSVSSLKVYIRYFKSMLKIKDDSNIKQFLEECKRELERRE